MLFDSRVMDKFTVWTNEFFNRSVRTVYDLADPSLIAVLNSVPLPQLLFDLPQSARRLRH